MKQSGIYKLEWKESGYYYYGQSINLKERKVQHLTKIRKNKHYNKMIQSVSNKYGLPEFIVVEFCEHDKLDELEQFYIDKYIKEHNCCNVSPSSYSVRGLKWSDESKKRASNSAKGRVITDETRKNLSMAVRKRYADGFKVIGLKGKDNGFYKKKHDLITKLIMSQKKQGIYLGGNNPKAILILNTETGIFYETIREAAKTQTRYKEATVGAKIKNKKKNNLSFIAV